MELHELAPVGGRPANLRFDGGRLLPAVVRHWPRLGDQRDEPDVATTLKGTQKETPPPSRKNLAEVPLTGLDFRLPFAATRPKDLP